MLIFSDIDIERGKDIRHFWAMVINSWTWRGGDSLDPQAERIKCLDPKTQKPRLTPVGCVSLSRVCCGLIEVLLRQD